MGNIKSRYDILLGYVQRVHPGQYKKTEDDILTIIDAAIVNSSQAKAIKELIRRAFEDMETACWDKLVEK